jgi:hypothetical protein
MGLADKAARAASAARSAGGTAADAAKAAKGSATAQGAFKVTKPATTKPTTKPATTKPATKPATPAPAVPSSIESILGIQEATAVNETEAAYDAGKLLRDYQIKQSYAQLQDALGTIDRAAISNYKDIANDYAARGMSRSGGFMGAESAAIADKDRADTQANAARTSFLEQLATEDFIAQGGKNSTIQAILADYLARKFASAQGG